MILKPNSSLNIMEFNPKDINQILGGCVNGQVCRSKQLHLRENREKNQ